MQFFSQLSDDQFALLGCAVALIVTGTMMSLSHYIGLSKQRRMQKTTRTLKPGVQHSDRSQRRAA